MENSVIAAWLLAMRRICLKKRCHLSLYNVITSYSDYKLYVLPKHIEPYDYSVKRFVVLLGNHVLENNEVPGASAITLRSGNASTEGRAEGNRL